MAIDKPRKTLRKKLHLVNTSLLRKAKQYAQLKCERSLKCIPWFKVCLKSEGVKPFECLTCGVAWADARSLKRHVRTHTGERPYVCPVCNEAYIDARNLRKHMTKYHSNYIPCKIMLEKDSLQFHHQGTQVEHAVSFVANELVEPQSEIINEEMETVLVAGNVGDSEEAASATTQECPGVSSLSDQSIMQVVNYVLAQQQGAKLEVTDQIETVEVEVGQVSEVL